MTCLRTQSEEIKFFSVIMDDTADIPINEQVSACFHVVTEKPEPEELFLGIYETSTTTGDTLFQLFKDVLRRFSLPVSKCGSNVSGIRTALQARVQEPWAASSLHVWWIDNTDQKLAKWISHGSMSSRQRSTVLTPLCPDVLYFERGLLTIHCCQLQRANGIPRGSVFRRQRG